MKKLLLSLLFMGFISTVNAQYEYSPTGRDEVPVMGKQFGILAGGFTSMMPNRDDIDADKRLDPQAMNFSYAGGVEYVYWFQKSVGFGTQLNFWQGGAAYKGIDTFTKISLEAKTKLSYLKIPFLFHFKSFNRYHPNRRMRFNAYFGPYVALLSSSSDDFRYYNDSTKYELKGSVTNKKFTSGTTKGVINGNILNFYDVGFVFAVGGEMRISRRTVLTLHVRTDVGITNIENTRGLKIKYDGSSTDQDFNYWKDMYSKYNPATALDKATGWVSNRPATKNFSTGVFLSFRKYF